jgi:hypothetical protein
LQIADGAADVEEPISIESDPFVAEEVAEVAYKGDAEEATEIASEPFVAEKVAEVSFPFLDCLEYLVRPPKLSPDFVILALIDIRTSSKLCDTLRFLI